MHTVRNRVASKPRSKGKMPPRGTRKKQEPAFMLKSGNAPAFPVGLIVPPPRGAMITAVPWPEIAAPKARATTKPNTRRKAAPPKVRKPRTAAPNAAAPPASAKRKPRAVAKPPVTAGQPPAQDAAAAMMTENLLDRALAIKPLSAEDVLILPSTSATLARSATPTTSPIPRSKALAPARGFGLFDIIGHWLRDAGSWLGRWNKRGRKDEERARKVRARARHHALQSQFDALEALRQVAKAD